MNVGIIVDLDEVSCFALEIQLSADSALCFKYYWIRIYFCAVRLTVLLNSKKYLTNNFIKPFASKYKCFIRC